MTLAKGDAQTRTLADRERGGARMAARLSTVRVHERPGHRLPVGAIAEGITDVAAGHEAQLLALRLGRRDEPQVGCDGAHLRLRQFAEREAAVGQLVLAQPVQEVALVLVPIDAGEQVTAHTGRAARVGHGAHPSVVPGRHGIARVQDPGTAQERPELDGAVAVDAGTGGAARQVRLGERAHHPGRELALEIEDVERDAQLPSHATGVVRGVGRAARALDIRERVSTVMETHPDAHGLGPGTRHERGRDR